MSQTPLLSLENYLAKTDSIPHTLAPSKHTWARVSPHVHKFSYFTHCIRDISLLCEVSRGDS